MALSNISLALLEDSGWYMPNYNYADFLWWGWKQGCDFVEGKCPIKNGEYCNDTLAIGCNVYGDAKTVCQQKSSSGVIVNQRKNCPMQIRFSELGNCHIDGHGENTNGTKLDPYLD
jgi:hypothetical protein